MSWRSALILISCGVFHAQMLHAQDDVPWWRQLFGTSQVDPSEVPVPEHRDSLLSPRSDFIEGKQDEIQGGSTSAAPPESVGGFLAPLRGSGSLDLHIPEGIVALDTLQSKPEDVRIPGFRIQLFMGKLDSARSLRNHLLSEGSIGFNVHLAPYPPAFGVQIGDFRTFLSAHREKRNLMNKFPDALVVPAELRVEEAYPLSSDCIRTP